MGLTPLAGNMLSQSRSDVLTCAVNVLSMCCHVLSRDVGPALEARLQVVLDFSIFISVFKIICYCQNASLVKCLDPSDQIITPHVLSTKNNDRGVWIKAEV